MAVEMMNFIDLVKQQDLIREKLNARIQAVLKHGQYIMGPEITELEKGLATYTGSKHCLTMSSGTDALLVAMMALDIGPGDEVITTPFTFFATIEMILLLGATPILTDIDPETYNLDPKLIEAAITPKTKAIVPVSLYGQCADFDEINAIGKKHKIIVIEDAAQSFGGTYKGKKSCAVSDIGCTSFFPSKPLGCYGDGGACFTDNDELNNRMNEIRLHGQEKRYSHASVGINGRFDTLQAAIMLPKLEIFPQEVAAREKLGARYTQLINDAGLEWVKPPKLRSYNTSPYAQYSIQVPEREKVQNLLKDLGIPTAVHYPVPVNKQKAFINNYKGPKIAAGALKVSDEVSDKIMSLPMHPYLSDADQTRVVGSLKEVLSKVR